VIFTHALASQAKFDVGKAIHAKSIFAVFDCSLRTRRRPIGLKIAFTAGKIESLKVKPVYNSAKEMTLHYMRGMAESAPPKN
jgi:hypothetical protein